MSDPLVSFPIRLQLAPSTSLPAQPSSQPSTRVSDQPSSSAFASTCDLRRLPILRPTFRLTSSLRLRPILSQTLQPIFRLTSPINLPVPPLHRPATCAACRSSSLPSNRLPACAFHQPSSLTYKPNLRLSSAAAFSSCFRTAHRLASLTDPPARLRANPLAFASGQPSGCTFQLASDFRRLPTFQPPLSNPTSDSHRLLDSLAAYEPICDLRRLPTLRLRLRANLWLSPPANLPAVSFT